MIIQKLLFEFNLLKIGSIGFKINFAPSNLSTLLKLFMHYIIGEYFQQTFVFLKTVYKIAFNISRYQICISLKQL